MFLWAVPEEMAMAVQVEPVPVVKRVVWAVTAAGVQAAEQQAIFVQAPQVVPHQVCR